jgi:flagellar biosynthetic protein FliR
MMPEFLRQALAPDRWPVFVLISARLGGLMIAAPLWSMTALPKKVRAAITVLLSILLLPLAPQVALPDHFIELPLPVAMELVVGLAIGLTAAVLVQGVALAGEVISLQMGLSLGPALAPMEDTSVSGVGQLATFLTLFIYISLNGHLILFRGLADSLQTLPPGMSFGLERGGQTAAMLFGTLFDCAVRAAAPVMVTLLLVNIALAILSRAVPQLNVMMVSFPVTIAAGLVMFGLAVPLISTVAGGWMQHLPASVAGVIQSFQPAP